MDGQQIPTGEHRDIDITLIDPAPSNYRRKLGDLTEMAASMRRLGVLQPVLVRPTGMRYELVAGSRRYGSAKLAEVGSIPCVVREMSDDDVLEVQIIENSQRADVHPLDEADAFEGLIKRGRTAAQIADKIGKSATYVAQRLVLCQLTKEARAALDEDKFSLGAAVALARVPGKLQHEAVTALLDDLERGSEGGTVTAAQARSIIEEDFMLRLATAPFPVDDATLNKKAGPCTTCPKRTGNQGALFADVKSADLCTDPPCFREKSKQYFPIAAKEAREAGQTVLEGKAAKKALERHSYNNEYMRVDSDREYLDGVSVDVRKLVTKSNAPIALAQDPETGAPVELVKRADVRKAAAVQSPAAAKKTSEREEAFLARQRKVEQAAKRRKRVIALTIEKAVAAAEARACEGPATHKVSDCIDVFVRAFIVRAWSDTVKAIITRRGLEVVKPKHRTHDTSNEGALLAAFEAMTRPQRLGLGVELGLLVLSGDMDGKAGAPRWSAAMKALGVDALKVQDEVTAEEKERAAKKAKPKPAPAKPAKKGKAKK